MGLHWGYIGIMEKKMETTIWGLEGLGFEGIRAAKATILGVSHSVCRCNCYCRCGCFRPSCDKLGETSCPEPCKQSSTGQA